MGPDAEIVLSLFSIVILFALISVLFGCVCGCRKTVPKNELMGLAGMVKLTNPDENVNFTTPPPVVQLDPVVITADHLLNQASELNKRPNSTLTSATRSLPDLPVETNKVRQNTNTWEAAEPNGDTSSDLYATVEDKAGRGERSKRELPRDPTIESSYDSPSQTDNSMSPYASVKREHPYDQLKQKAEHPYAQVRNSAMAGPSHVLDISLHQSLSTSSVEGPESPTAPPRSRKSISLSQSSTLDIPAASAIAGGIPANHELPYMTPPLAAAAQQQHFSGDSQDSKGYTSISVREPLSNILGHMTRRQEVVDSHYTSVSDDSDEMYAAIEEPNQAVYTSDSETYAQIRPMMAVPALRTENLQPPTPHLMTTVKIHSRQESSSSASSCNASPASPKPEKRQANSPLPRPPDPGHPALDDMYAKVMKKRRSSHSISSTDHEPVEPAIVSGYETVQRSVSPHFSTPGYETVINNCNNIEEVSCSGYETLEGEHDSLAPGYERVAGGRDEPASDSEPNYEELRPQNGWDSTYATVNKKQKPPEPDYASLSRKDPGYEHVEGFDPNYESVCRDSDPNYESVQKLDPPYEKVEATSSEYVPVYNQDRTEDVYSQVNKEPTVR